ncbi:MAG: CotH kinase family protein [Bacilli bacterium]
MNVKIKNTVFIAIIFSLLTLSGCDFQQTLDFSSRVVPLTNRVTLKNIKNKKNTFKSSTGENFTFYASGMKTITNRTFKNATIKNRDVIRGIKNISISKSNDSNEINKVEVFGGYVIEGIIEYVFSNESNFDSNNKVTFVFGEANGYPDYCKIIFKSEIEISKISIDYSDVSNGTTIKPKSNLPYVVIDTDEKGILTKDYVETKVQITNVENEADALDESPAQMKIRGNSTSWQPKKPYRIKFDKKQKVFGKKKNKSWVLLADYLDPSALHNYTAFKLTNYFNRTAYSPLAQHVRVYIDNEYNGLYLLTEHPDEKEGRTNVPLLFNEDLSEFSYTMELDQTANQDEDIEAYFPIKFQTQEEFLLALKAPDKKDFLEYYQEKDLATAEAQTEITWNAFLEYLEGQVLDIKNSLNSNDFETMDDLFDQDSFVDYMLIDQIMGEEDHYNKSFKFYRRLNEKIKFGPIWDYDIVMHTPWTNLPNDHPGINQPYYSNSLMKQYFGVLQNKQALADRWYDIGEDAILELCDHLEEYSADLQDELYEDADLWYEQDYALVDRNITYIIDYIYNQIDVLDIHFNAYR